MAQIVKLRRSSVSGQKPTNSNLELGELALNTTDGKVYMAKSGSLGPSIEELISTNTVNTGSINLIGSVTASYFVGDGSKLTNLTLPSSAEGRSVKLTQTTPSTLWTFTHGLGERFPVIEVFDSNGFVVIPTNVEAVDTSKLKVYFSSAQNGTVTATVGGGLPSISGSYVGYVLSTDGSVPSWKGGLVSGSSQLTQDFDTRYVMSGSITQTTWDNIASKPTGIVSGSSQITLDSTTGYSTFSSSIANTDSSQNTKITSLETASGSIRTDFNSYTSSVNNSLSSINDAIEFTGSNLTVKGNLLVKGTNTTVNSTTLDIGDNIIQLNGTGATNAGLVVRDATSPNTVSGSLLWDTSNDQWIAGPVGSEQKVILSTDLSSLNTFTSSINTIIKSKLNSDGVISGSSQVLSGTGIWSGSAQLPSGVVSGSGQISYGSISGIPSGIVSGSSQISFGSVTGIPSGLVSGSGQITLSSTSGFGTYINQAVLTTSSPTFAGLTTTSVLTVGTSNAGQPGMYITRVGGYATIKGSTANGGDGQIVIDGVSNSAGVYLNNYVSGSVFLATGGGTTYVGAVLPHSTAAFDLGSSSVRWRTIYTSDLSLSNGIGDYTIVEGEEKLYLYNNKNNKVYSFVLQEEDPDTATPKLPQ